ncbi:MAG: hypothetical protein NVSMB9_07010 [Isosphaeraceae bacterium]
MASVNLIRRDWIAAEFSKGIDAEQALIDEAKSRAQNPPSPALQVLYNEIATADERHRIIVETIATRYGHTPSHSVSGGIGETLSRLKDKVGEMGTGPLQRVSHDLVAKANVIHWCTAWVETFEAIGDHESSKELGAVLAEEIAHRDALQAGLNRMVTQGATSEDKPAS